MAFLLFCTSKDRLIMPNAQKSGRGVVFCHLLTHKFTIRILTITYIGSHDQISTNIRGGKFPSIDHNHCHIPASLRCPQCVSRSLLKIRQFLLDLTDINVYRQIQIFNQVDDLF